MCAVECGALNFAGPFQFVFQIIQVVVGEHAEFRAAEPRGVHDAGVDQFVEHDDVILAEQRADGADGRGVAGGETQRGFGVFEGGERFLQFVKRRERAANQARGAGAGAEFFDGLDGGFFQNRIIGEAEIIVGRKIEQGLAADFDARPCGESTRRSSRNRFCSRRVASRGFNSASSKSTDEIYVLRFTVYEQKGGRRGNRESQIGYQFGVMAHLPSIMEART